MIGKAILSFTLRSLCVGLMTLSYWGRVAEVQAVDAEQSGRSGLAQSGMSEVKDITKTVKRGLGGRIQFDHPSPYLVAKSDQSLDGPVLVRLERLGGRETISENEHAYELRFFGVQAGVFDVAERIKVDGATSGESSVLLDPIWVQIVSDLPSNRGTDLYEITDPQIGVWTGYRSTAITLALIWCSIPMIILFLRLRNRHPEAAAVSAIPPTVSQRLIGLVDSARDRNLREDEKAEFEFLFYKALGDRYQLPESLIRSVPLLRRHESVAGSLAAVEHWLHSGKAAELNDEGQNLREAVRQILIDQKFITADAGESRLGDST